MAVSGVLLSPGSGFLSAAFWGPAPPQPHQQPELTGFFGGVSKPLGVDSKALFTHPIRVTMGFLVTRH